MNDNKEDFVKEMLLKTKQLTLRSLKVFQSLPKTEEARIIGKQFLRLATSVEANYRAVCRARSKAEYFSKLSITIEETDETMFWIEILINLGYYRKKNWANCTMIMNLSLKSWPLPEKTPSDKSIHSFTQLFIHSPNHSIIQK